MDSKLSAAKQIVALSAGYNVVIRSIAIPAGTLVPVVDANPQRWSLTFIHQNAPNIVAVLPTGNMGNGVPGFEVLNIPPYTVFTQRDHPAFVALAWEATASANSVLCVIEILKI